MIAPDNISRQEFYPAVDRINYTLFTGRKTVLQFSQETYQAK